MGTTDIMYQGEWQLYIRTHSISLLTNRLLHVGNNKIHLINNGE